MSSSVISNSTPRRSRKRHKPIARVTSYDYNVQYDLRRKMETKNNRSGSEGLFATPVHNEAYNVMEGEVLVSIDKSAAYRDAGKFKSSTRLFNVLILTKLLLYFL